MTCSGTGMPVLFPLELKVVSKVTPSRCSGVIALPSLSDPFGTSPWTSCSPRRLHTLRYRPGTAARLIAAERGSNYLQEAARSLRQDRAQAAAHAPLARERSWDPTAARCRAIEDDAGTWR